MDAKIFMLMRTNLAATTDDCWLWLGSQQFNRIGRLTYGVAHFNGKKIYAHRLAYVAFVGQIPEGLTIDHLCRNTLCINPWHLEPVPIHINLARGESPSAKAARRDKCLHGHKFDGRKKTRGGWQRTCSECRAQEQIRARHRKTYKYPVS